MLTELRLWLLKELLSWYFARERKDYGQELAPRFYFGECPSCRSKTMALDWVKGL